MVNLTSGALTAILEERLPEKPVVQVLNMKKIVSQTNTPERWRLQISDGNHYQPCMMAPQLNSLVTDNKIHKFCLIRMDRYICNVVHGRKIIILIQTSVVKAAEQVGGCALGDPQILNLMTTAEPSPGQNGRPSPAISSKPVDGGGRGDSGGPATGAYHNTAPPFRPPFGGASVMTSPGGTPLSSRNIIPITGLNPYQNRWTIKVRVSSKPAIRTWSNSRGEGKVFNVDLVDSSGDVRASSFNDVADKMHSLFELGKVYYISRGRLKPANRSFNTTSCEYEISLNEESEVELCMEVDTSLPTMTYNFVSIDSLQGVEPNSVIDVIGVCRDASSLTTIVTKAGKQLSKRDIHLVDRSNHIVNSTMWGAEAEGFEDDGKFPVIAVKGARVSEFGGRSLNIGFNSVMAINPDIPEAHQLRGWFDNFGKNVETTSISESRGGGTMQTAFLTLSQVKELNLGQREKPDYFSVKASIVFVKKDNCLYKACPSAECNKKVTEDNMGGYFCEKCNQSFPEFKYRMILSINTADHSESQWMTCFQDAGATEILGKSAQDLGELREADENAFDNIFQQANFKEFVFRARAKMDTYNDEQRLKCYCVGVAPVNFVQEIRRNLELIKQMM